MKIFFPSYFIFIFNLLLKNISFTCTDLVYLFYTSMCSAFLFDCMALDPFLVSSAEGMAGN